MRKLSVFVALVVLAGFAAASPALSQDEGGGDDADTPAVVDTPLDVPSAEASAPASDEEAALPDCPPGRTTTLSGAACAPPTPASEVSQPPFETLGVLSGAAQRILIAGADAR